eukprot:TRINITY_DN4214_c0_g1_i3.p1 TRINITY_DN4214_c0_g1~~TRINITY_DN4214_c0_g1_i3.p1  ORF type:complete len:150 (-),score=18.06 TRINITY_DN4214_c0_g1_i3:165-614(-)
MLLVLLEFLCRRVCDLLHYVYPIYASSKSIQLKDEASQQYWLIFWIAQSPLLFLEFLPFFTFTSYRFYYELKLAYLLWILLPHFKGSEMLWQRAIEPTLAQHEAAIDASLSVARQQARHYVTEWGRDAFSKFATLAITALTKIQASLRQ